jgi:hypothetical protein
VLVNTGKIILRKGEKAMWHLLRNLLKFKSKCSCSYDSRVTLADNVDPDSAKWAIAQDVGSKIIKMVENREVIIEREELDQAFCLSAENWSPDAPNDFFDAYRLLKSLDWNEVKYLRLRSQAFSGFSLLHMLPAKGFYSTEPIPTDFNFPDYPPNRLIAHLKSLIKELPQDRLVRPPAILGEIGWMVDGILVNDDTRSYQERMTLLHSCGALDRLTQQSAPCILEIGGGYGALALAITNCLPKASYVICDLPESLLFSGLYLSLAGRNVVVPEAPEDIAVTPGIYLVPNYRFDSLKNIKVDLGINTLSMSEMSHHQIRTYASGLKKMLQGKGVFFEQNHDNRPSGLTYAAAIVKEIFESRKKVVLSGVPLTQGSANLWGPY